MLSPITKSTPYFIETGTGSNLCLSMCRDEVNANVNIFSISFFNELGSVTESVDFILWPLPIMAGTAGKALTVADIYPINGIVQSKIIKKEKEPPVEELIFNISHFVRPKIRKEIESHAEILDEECKYGHTRCLVIDFKDTQQGYGRKKDICFAEKKFAKFFQGDGLDKKDTHAEIFNLFKKCKIDFFINEGSLKAKLLKKAFSLEQSAFFQNKEGKGPALLCQICEMLMNAFKQNCGVIVNGYLFNPQKYMSFVNNALRIQQGGKKADLQTTSLLTLYPNRVYEETYGYESDYYQFIKDKFRTAHDIKNNTTIITIE